MLKARRHQKIRMDLRLANFYLRFLIASYWKLIRIGVKLLVFVWLNHFIHVHVHIDTIHRDRIRSLLWFRINFVLKLNFIYRWLLVSQRLSWLKTSFRLRGCHSSSVTSLWLVLVTDFLLLLNFNQILGSYLSTIHVAVLSRRTSPSPDLK